MAERDALGHDPPASGGTSCVDQVAGADGSHPGVGRPILPGEVGQLVQDHIGLGRPYDVRQCPSVPRSAADGLIWPHAAVSSQVSVSR
jgi:hypothetical protein